MLLMDLPTVGDLGDTMLFRVKGVFMHAGDLEMIACSGEHAIYYSVGAGDGTPFLVSHVSSGMPVGRLATERHARQLFGIIEDERWKKLKEQFTR